MKIRIDRLAFGGEGVGRAPDGKVVFVPRTAPGDLVDVEIVSDKARHAHARLVTIVEPSPERVAPPCPHFSACGSCQWQHVSLPAQMSAKQAIVERLFGAIVRPLMTSEKDLGYRVRAKLTAQGDRIGYFAWHSHEVIAFDSCPALEPALDRALAAAKLAFENLLGDGNLYGVVTTTGVEIAIYVGVGGDTAAAVTAARDLVGAGGICRTNVVGGESFGEIADGDFAVRAADGFAQANDAQNDRLRALVTAELRNAPTILELYAGDGNFTAPLVANGAQVTAVEADARAVVRLRSNAPGATAIAAPTLRALQNMRGQTFDAILLDPPRAGAKDIIALLPRLKARTIVYVSCDPNTLKRDVDALAKLGYMPRFVQPIDMMPHTSHIEAVCVLDKT